MYLLNLFVFFLFISQSAYGASGINVSKLDILHVCNPEILAARDLDRYNSAPSTITINGEKYNINLKLLPGKITIEGGGFHRVISDAACHPTILDAIHALPGDTIAFSDSVDGRYKTSHELNIIHKTADATGTNTYVCCHEIPLHEPDKYFSFFILELEKSSERSPSLLLDSSTGELPYR